MPNADERPMSTRDTYLNLQLVREDIREDINEIKTAISKMADSMTKLALVEERQLQHSLHQQKLVGVVDALTLRLISLEASNREASRITNWVDKGILATLGAVALYVAGKLGLM